MEVAPKKSGLHLSLLDGVLLCLAAGIIVFSIWTVLGATGHAATCRTTKLQHILTVAHDTFPAPRMLLNRCDTVKIFNAGNETYELAFGQHDSHLRYPGFSEQILKPHEFIIFTAAQSGTYPMHDHLRDRAKIEFVIN